MYGPADYVVTHERVTGGDTGIGKRAPAECRRAGKHASVALPVHEDNYLSIPQPALIRIYVVLRADLTRYLAQFGIELLAIAS